MNKEITAVLYLVVVLLGWTGSAHATLIVVGDSDEMVYDTDLDVTWLRDVMHARTSGFNSGQMHHSEAVQWVSGLNVGGLTEWRLPNSIQPDLGCINQINSIGQGINCTRSELGHLFYIELGNNPFFIGCVRGVDCGPANTGPFQNIALEFTNNPPDIYWSNVGTFNFGNGVQTHGINLADNFFRALAVHNGGSQLVKVPEPSTIALFATGLFGLGFVRKRQA